MMILANCEARCGIEAAWSVLTAGGSALDAVERASRAAEIDTGVRTVGRGAAPNLLGEMECDAAIMDGATRRAGAVGALRDYLHAITVARAVMEQTPHVILVGEGAARLAAEIGAERGELLTDLARDEHQAWVAAHVELADRSAWPQVPLAGYAWRSGEAYRQPDDTGSAPRISDTSVCLAIDDAGHLAAATSSSGWARKYPGRLGDSPIIGAGLYADDRYGACGCTHTGEMMIRAGTARMVVGAMQRGATVEEACHEAITDLAALRDGYLGSTMIHAIDREGRVCVLGRGDPQGAEHAYTKSDECDELVELEVVRVDR
jgi:L-asparaginase